MHLLRNDNVDAYYDSKSGRINLPSRKTQSNLFSWFGNEAHSHWSEYVSYNVHMVWLKEYGGNSFRLENCKNGAGISYNLTAQFKECGKGTYILTFKAKADKKAAGLISLGPNGINESGVNFSTEWKDYTITYDCTASPEKIKNAYFAFSSYVENAGIEFRDLELSYQTSE